MLKTIKKLIYDLLLVFLNYFVARIPCWHIRKLFYFIFGLKIGKGSRINQRVFLYNPWRIKIGSNTIVNSFAILDGRGGLTIGNNTSVSMRAVLYTASHKTYSDTFEYFEKPTVVEDCCWICTNAIILPGSQIKNLAVIGANSVFKGTAEEKTIYAGSPAKPVRDRDIDGLYEIKNREFFTKEGDGKCVCYILTTS